MSAVFVLVMMAYHGSIQTQEFFSAQSCEKARQQVMSMLVDTYGNGAKAVCVQK
jgi:hypothetical protein